jgi:FkbM family methyltransferase
VKTPWTVQHWQKYRGVLTLPSLVRLRSALMAERRGGIDYDAALVLRLKRPYATPLSIRPASNDIYTLDEILIERVYAGVLDAVPYAEVIVDLGANIGLSSIFFLGHYPHSRVIALEPDPRNYRLLKENLRRSTAAGRAQAIEAAAWERDGRVRFVPPEEPGHVNQGALAAGETERGKTVFGMAMPSIMSTAATTHVDILKVDIEGGEVNLFRGDTGWLASVKCIAIEFHGDSRRESDFDALMARHGFTCRDVGHTVVAVRQGTP